MKRIFDGQNYVDITDEEFNADMPKEEIPKGNEALAAFFEGLASSDTNSIAKIRALAKTFLENTGEG